MQREVIRWQSALVAREVRNDRNRNSELARVCVKVNVCTSQRRLETTPPPSKESASTLPTVSQSSSTKYHYYIQYISVSMGLVIASERQRNPLDSIANAMGKYCLLL